MPALEMKPATDDKRLSGHDIVARPLRHPWRWVAAALIAAGTSLGIISVWNNKNIEHDVIAQFLFDPRILNGVLMTIVLTACSMLLATVLATILAVMRLSSNPVMATVAWAYTWFFRGTPLLVQIVFWGYLGLLYANISVGIPMTELTIFTAPTPTVVTPFIAGLLALALNEAAYASEIVRAGLLSVDPGHVEAANSLGMSPRYTLRRIVLPQAMRIIIPPMGNETISMLKNSALLQLIAVQELYTRASDISAQNLRQVELLVVVSIWYLLLTTVLSVPQYFLERRYGRGVGRRVTTPWQRLRHLSSKFQEMQIKRAPVNPSHTDHEEAVKEDKHVR
ncbi:amino acid ABC transporter permease [Arthrobacter sp. SLBN-112]|uniref:amino acid ABC transporter permease n=1 Tax=Arthrobacter sp. SLBN-112 TaxID=2768452 RepID=UPI0027B049BD|nr:amino acid ABC transporter permease [Arthrobacter sp. SLBN-112]MDQ0799386.1 polar amino acid transport system permease protein [Arthrobacter sp. SLBN-112]